MPSSSLSSPASWSRRAAARFVVLLPLKAFGTAVFLTLFFWAYFTVLRHPLLPPAVMPLTPVDAWIPFSAAAFPVYASLWVYVSLPPAFLASVRALVLYGAWVGAMCIFCLALFWLFPTAVPAFAIDWDAHPELGMLKGLDAAGNACPSLHVASAVFSAWWLVQLVRRLAAPATLAWMATAHCLLILWSTVALRQHVVLDVVAGALVGGVFALLSYRHLRRAAGDAL